jgi:hypothetical protein
MEVCVAPEPLSVIVEGGFTWFSYEFTPEGTPMASRTSGRAAPMKTGQADMRTSSLHQTKSGQLAIVRPFAGGTLLVGQV